MIRQIRQRTRTFIRQKLTPELEAGDPTNGRLVLGHRSYAHDPRIVVHHNDPDYNVTVGAYTSIADGVTFIVGGNHQTRWISTYPFDEASRRGHPHSRGPITVGNDVWIGMGAVVVSGVSIGDGAVVAGYAVVTRDVEPYTVVAGNPAQPVRQRFTPDETRALLAMRWWDWPHEKVAAAEEFLCAGDVAALVRFADAFR